MKRIFMYKTDLRHARAAAVGWSSSPPHSWCSAVSSWDPSASPTFPVLRGLFGELSTTLGKHLS